MANLTHAARRALLDWYGAHKRDLPWRRTRDPYAVWVSEVMLQQTQVATVEPYWRRWMERFPTVQSLAETDEHDLLSVWQGLGYYRRARLLQAGACYVLETGLPHTEAEWRKVPGVGPYTASAIASIAQGVPAPLVDGNVERVYSRVAADGASGPALTKNAWQWASENLVREHPGDWNQALMELGATVCTPLLPSCSSCPLRRDCTALATETVHLFPARAPKPAVIQLAHVAWAPYYQGQFGLEKIPEGEWWHGMWQFPRAVCAEESRLRHLVGPAELEKVGSLRHTVTNHRIELTVVLARCESRSSSLSWYEHEQLASLPLPSPQRKALKLLLKHLDQSVLL